MKSLLKSIFIIAMRGLRLIAGATGFLRFLEARRANPWLLWLRSLFAIYDFNDLRRIDLPWWTLRSITLVEKFLAERPDARVFEYGSGASTFWLGRRAAVVISIEHDRDWADRVRAALEDEKDLGHVEVRYIEAPRANDATPYKFRSEREGCQGLDFQSYVESIAEEAESFDLIIVDGRCRTTCLEVALARLAPGGLLLFDNASRKRYRQQIDACTLARLDTKGLTACLPYPDQTTLFSRSYETLDQLSN